MAVIKVEVKNQLDIGKKRRVYFTCHPDDFEKHFKKICDDIFRTHDCAIYYTEDMTEEIAENEKETDLGRNNLFVIPVTFKLLSTPNRAMDEDFRYAIEHHIPVLPIMMESGLDVLYSLPNKFGELQYLTPYSTDTTEISYEEKLKKHLDAILISDEMAKRIRAAFDAYIFLSYRKKDRAYANQLMKLIHSNPECRDIAIWFDEFLTPGESFRESIDKILHDSKLFTLLVTPNLLEEPDGKPNFVMGEEYPAAQKSGINILPAEMVETDKAALREKYAGLPECVNPEDTEFYKQLLDSVTKIATEANNTPEHNFLIGLAYLDGIDVEVNREFALELITSAAEANLVEAIKKLCDMYTNGIGVQLDYRKAVVWAEKYADYMVETYGEDDTDTLAVLNYLAVAYTKAGNHKMGLKLEQKVHFLNHSILGEEHPNTLTSLNNLVASYNISNNFQEALELGKKVYTIQCKVLGKEHPKTLGSLSNLAHTYSGLGDYNVALKLNEYIYSLRCKILGSEHPHTLYSLNNLANCYGELGFLKKSLEINQKIYTFQHELLGEERPETLDTLNNLACTYSDLGDYEKSLEINKKVYAIRCNLLGNEHPCTLYSLRNITLCYSRLNFHTEAIEIAKELHAIYCNTLGEEHLITLENLSNLAVFYKKSGKCQKALELEEHIYSVHCKVLGEEHPDTLGTLNNLASTFAKLGEHQKALKIDQKVYTLSCKTLGITHPFSLKSLNNLAISYYNTGNYKDSLTLLEKAYNLRYKTLGEKHPDTLNTLCNLALSYKRTRKIFKSAKLMSKYKKITKKSNK